MRRRGQKRITSRRTATAFCTSKNTLRTRGNGAFSARFRCNQSRFSCRIGALLRFAGEYLYSVKNVALYQYLYGGEVADIPAYEAYTRYDVKKLVSDFMALCSPPIREEEENTLLNQNYEQEGDSIILLPYDKRGVYKVLYEHRPTAIENTGATTEDTQELDLDDELCSLMPILVAAYVWIEDEPEKSEYYMSLYRERVQEIVLSHKDTSPVLIKNVNGW